MDLINSLSPTMSGTPSKQSLQTHVFQVSALINNPSMLTQELLKKCVLVKTKIALLFNVPSEKTLSSVSFRLESRNTYSIGAKDHQNKDLTIIGKGNLSPDSNICFVCDPEKQVSGELTSDSLVKEGSQSNDSSPTKRTKSGSKIPDLFKLTPEEKLKKALRDSITQSPTHAQNLKVEFNDGTNVSLHEIIPLRLLRGVNNQKSITLEYFDTSKGFQDIGNSGTKGLEIQLENVSSIDFSQASSIHLEKFLKRQLDALIPERPESAKQANIITINLLDGTKISLGKIVPVSVRDSSGSNILFTYYPVDKDSSIRSRDYKNQTIDLSNVMSIESKPGSLVLHPRTRRRLWLT